MVSGKIPFSWRAGKVESGVGTTLCEKKVPWKILWTVYGLSKVEDIEPLLYLAKKTPHGPMGRTEGSNAAGFHDLRLRSNNRPAHTSLPAQDAAGMRLGVWGLH